jgi:alginate O-acetyltransferase complex protein AlgI
MLINDYITFIYVAIFVVFYNLVKHVSRYITVRNILIAGGNLFMLLTLVKEHTIIVIAVLSLLVFVIGKILQKRSFKLLLWVTLFLIISLFAIRNYPFIQDLLSGCFLSVLNAPILSVQKLGLSYILFRYVHWIIESYRRKIHDSNFLCFVNYILFFPTILAGPIDTYTNFHYWVGNKKLVYQRSLFFAGISRIFIGAVKTLLIVPFVIQYAVDYSVLIPEYTPATALLISLFAYSFYIYFDFSGYCDIAIGTAYLIGIKTPENFNNPYISQNLSEFWKRWHITFSNFLKLYVFKPFINLFNRIINPKHRLLVTTLSYLATFAVCGIWHGSTLNFVYWGLWHGAGLAINKIWVVKVKHHLPFCNTKAYVFASILVTFVYVTIGWVFFVYSTQQLYEIYKIL